MEKKEELSKPLFSFNIFVPINIAVSGKPEFLKKLERYCEEKSTTKTELMNKLLSSGLKDADINGYKELLKESGNYTMMTRSVKDSINGYLSASNISRYFKEELEKRWKDEKFE